jgi:CRISPR-associated endoribonuclease Cas6
LPKPQKPQQIPLQWSTKTELIGLQLHLQPQQDILLPANYTTQLHSWFLDRVRRLNPTLSAQLHDHQTEKPFTLSSLEGLIQPEGRSLHFLAGQTYRWSITALSKTVVKWMQQWLQQAPLTLELPQQTFTITHWSISHPPTTYLQLLPTTLPDNPEITLSFLTPTGFRRKGSHFPLPLSFNIFQSYLRRWNDFSGRAIDPTDFLNWVDENVIILRHHLRSHKVAAGKSGSVTGFTGAVQYGITPKGQKETDCVQLLLALGHLAPYSGTGHKTTFGLGQTVTGWHVEAPLDPQPSAKIALNHRIAELTDIFMAQRKRTGGDRALNISQTWATILARREQGESLLAIAEDLEMHYETVKRYSKLARRSLK